MDPGLRRGNGLIESGMSLNRLLASTLRFHRIIFLVHRLCLDYDSGIKAVCGHSPASRGIPRRSLGTRKHADHKVPCARPPSLLQISIAAQAGVRLELFPGLSCAGAAALAL